LCIRISSGKLISLFLLIIRLTPWSQRSVLDKCVTCSIKKAAEMAEYCSQYK
jgi:hypothetical protein